MGNKIHWGQRRFIHQLDIMQKFLPGSRLILCKMSRGEGVGRMILKNFPDVQIIYGSLSENGEVDSEDLISV